MVVTSVSGHLMELEFPAETKNWRATSDAVLFDQPVRKIVKDAAIEKNLMQEARNATHLVCWLDCDREGENISYEVIQVCLSVNPRLRVLRARFSSLTQRDLQGALNTLGAPDEKSSLAVDARQEIDLRIGSVFTRWQTKLLRERFQGIQKIVSYGPCQFPTLGFVVSRYWEHKGFTPEQFHFISLEHKTDGSFVKFKWARDRIYDLTSAALMYQRCCEDGQLKIKKVTRKSKSKWRPVPLATVELQKLAARHLRFGSEKTMRIAETLYQETVLSYPRTETDLFTMTDGELQNLIKIQATDDNHTWAPYASNLLNPAANKYQRPRVGRHDDKAHPPIHPTKSGGHLTGDKKLLYELVSRHFLACCSKDALADEVVVYGECGEEDFSTSGQTIVAKNYLEVYTYDRWSDSTIPNYEEGEIITPTSCTLNDGTTTAPPLLAEVDLIATMDRNQIGTDATIAQHIKTIKDRGYVTVENMIYTPTKLGLALVEAYDVMGFAALSLPKLRAAMEADLSQIVSGRRSHGDVVATYVSRYREIFSEVQSKKSLLVDIVSRWYPASEVVVRVVTEVLSVCGSCGQKGQLVDSGTDEDVQQSFKCVHCDILHPLPRGVFRPKGFSCPLCNFEVLDVASDKTPDKVTHQLCPHCFSNPPAGEIENHAVMGSMRCFQCVHESCALAGKTQKVWSCPNRNCGQDLSLSRSKHTDDTYWIGCKGYKTHKCPHSVNFPRGAVVTLLPQKCPAHGASLVKIQFRFGVHNAEWMMYCEPDFSVVTCCWCEQRFDGSIQVKGYQPGTRGGRLHTPVGSIPSQSNPLQQLNRVGLGARNPGPPPQRAPEQTGSAPKCACNLECDLRTANTEANRGRQFFICKKGGDQKCNFFVWASEYIPDQNIPRCTCNESCIVKTAATEANKGRRFAKCATGKCGFFEWLNQ
eukprot:TRINITY_DN2110_c2_g1_i7.p1 TRINITY_DN2110_c2_g1~~TRINITY_DN2110_c2_g1_i7.p1  ORF type:complete len:926 (+),score=94.01 TRINITY_DN2110_c2_g1_i7:248-3025(+)